MNTPSTQTKHTVPAPPLGAFIRTAMRAAVATDSARLAQRNRRIEERNAPLVAERERVLRGEK